MTALRSEFAHADQQPVSVIVPGQVNLIVISIGGQPETFHAGAQSQRGGKMILGQAN